MLEVTLACGISSKPPKILSARGTTKEQEDFHKKCDSNVV